MRWLVPGVRTRASGDLPGTVVALSTVRRFSSGTILEGKYEIDRVIGSGGMGDVYLVRHSILGQRFALKVLHQAGIGEEERRRFLTEAKVTTRFENEHIVKTIDFGVLPDGSSFSVMEYLEGEDLEARLQRKKKLPVNEAAKYMLQTCIGLASAHREGVVHRDLKPANLFLAKKQGGAKVLKILDFGLAKTYSLNESLTASHSIFGTPTHMSPEQLRASKNVDTRADLWAIGVIFYELVTGELPFDATSPALYFGEVLHKEPRPMSTFGIQDARLESLIMRLLRKDPNERPSDVVVLADELTPFASFDGLALSGEVAAVMGGNLDSSVGAGPVPHVRDPMMQETTGGPGSQTTQISPDTQDRVMTKPDRSLLRGRTKFVAPVALAASIGIAAFVGWPKKMPEEKLVPPTVSSSGTTEATQGLVVPKVLPVPTNSPSSVQSASSTRGGSSASARPSRTMTPAPTAERPPYTKPAGSTNPPKIRQTDHL